jgi:hypothetical protein
VQLGLEPPSNCITLADVLNACDDDKKTLLDAGHITARRYNEMADEAGEENFFLFGLTAAQVASQRHSYNPHWHFENESETRAALDLISTDHFSRNEPATFNPLMDTLLKNGDYYMPLADLQAYLESDRQLAACMPTKMMKRGTCEAGQAG